MSSNLIRSPLPPLDTSSLLKALNWAYEHAIEGARGVDSAEQLAAAYAAASDPADEKAKRLVRWQVSKATTAGFLAGFGGILTLPVSIPANLAAVLFIQLRMVAAVAVLGGHDVRSEQVRTLAYACLCGSVANEVIKDIGLHLGSTLSTRAIRSVSFEVLKKLNQLVQARLLAGLGEKGLVTLGRVMPVAGGIIGGTLDGVSTYAIGRAARQLFTHNT